jgi:hypothetical protein
MQKTSKPDIKITFTRDLFNSMFTMFDYFKATAAVVGLNYYSRQAEKLSAKIQRYAQFYKGEFSDAATVYFFPNEITALTDLFAKYINLREEPDRDYYAEMRR